MITLTSSKPSLGGGIARSFFWLWGILGLTGCCITLVFAPVMVGIHTTLVWIGGIVFFGLAALMADRTYTLGPGIPVYVIDQPRADGLDEKYEGIPFMRLESGHIVAEFSNGKFTFENWDKFAKAAQRANPSPNR